RSRDSWLWQLRGWEQGLPVRSQSQETFMDATARIGPSIRIKGEVSAKEPLTIEGHVTGTINLSGHELTVSDWAHIDADVVAQPIIISGQVNGRLTAEGRVVVHQTASLEGDLSAPAVKVDDGAQLHGRVEVAGPRQLAVAGCPRPLRRRGRGQLRGRDLRRDDEPRRQVG